MQTHAWWQKVIGCLAMGARIKKNMNGHKESMQDLGYVHYLDCGDIFIGVLYVKPYQIVHLNIFSYIIPIIPQTNCWKYMYTKWEYTITYK